jgi:hypothetical protein
MPLCGRSCRQRLRALMPRKLPLSPPAVVSVGSSPALTASFPRSLVSRSCQQLAAASLYRSGTTPDETVEEAPTITHHSAMAFVTQYEHDVFVSYAHVDDEPLIDLAGQEVRGSGWVSTLIRNLKNELDRKVGRPGAVSVFFDRHNLQGNHTLTEEITARLERTAIFLAVLSPGYVSSDWCQEEAFQFSHAPGGLARRIFVVEKEEDVPTPGALSGRINYRFWFRDHDDKPRTFAVPVPRPEELDYFRKIEDLARDIREQLRAMGGALASPAGPVRLASAETAWSAVAQKSALGAVVLAEVTDDLEFRRDEVQRYLEQQGVLVLPESPYPLGRA